MCLQRVFAAPGASDLDSDIRKGDSESSSAEKSSVCFLPFFLIGKRTINNEPRLAHGEIRLASHRAHGGTVSITGPLAQPRGLL